MQRKKILQEQIARLIDQFFHMDRLTLPAHGHLHRRDLEKAETWIKEQKDTPAEHIARLRVLYKNVGLYHTLVTRDYGKAYYYLQHYKRYCDQHGSRKMKAEADYLFGEACAMSPDYHDDSLFQSALEKYAVADEKGDPLAKDYRRAALLSSIGCMHYRSALQAKHPLQVRQLLRSADRHANEAIQKLENAILWKHEFYQDLARAYTLKGLLSSQAGDFDSAEDYLTLAVRCWMNCSGHKKDYWHYYVTTQVAKADLLFRKQQYSEVYDFLDDLQVTIAERSAGSGSARRNPEVAMIHERMADALVMMAEYSPAISLYRLVRDMKKTQKQAVQNTESALAHAQALFAARRSATAMACAALDSHPHVDLNDCWTFMAEEKDIVTPIQSQLESIYPFIHELSAANREIAGLRCLELAEYFNYADDGRQALHWLQRAHGLLSETAHAGRLQCQYALAYQKLSRNNQTEYARQSIEICIVLLNQQDSKPDKEQQDYLLLAAVAAVLANFDRPVAGFELNQALSLDYHRNVVEAYELADQRGDQYHQACLNYLGRWVAMDPANPDLQAFFQKIADFWEQSADQFHPLRCGFYAMYSRYLEKLSGLQNEMRWLIKAEECAQMAYAIANQPGRGTPEMLQRMQDRLTDLQQQIQEQIQEQSLVMPETVPAASPWRFSQVFFPAASALERAASEEQPAPVSWFPCCKRRHSE